MARVRFESVRHDQIDWDELDSFEDRTLFQTRAWLELVQKTQRARPVVAAIKRGDAVIGYFTGMIFKKFGVRMLGSPFKGWTTPYMGFNMRDGEAKKDALQALPKYVFNKLGCRYLELVDRNLSDVDIRGLPFRVARLRIQEVNLARSEEEIFSSMKGNFRRNVQKSVREGLTVEEASPQGFAAEYYDQVLEVFGKQKRKPTYPVERVQALIDFIYPTGNVLLLRARDREGRPIATGIFPGYNKKMYFWGGASYQRYQYNRPNEAIMWSAIRYWRKRGAEVLDLGGYAHYKEKYRPEEIPVPVLMSARPGFLLGLRDMAYKLWAASWKLRGKVKPRLPKVVALDQDGSPEKTHGT
jgi:CelD/BcsL family acetyltransferase involved in cellulose biosynthesis